MRGNTCYQLISFRFLFLLSIFVIGLPVNAKDAITDTQYDIEGYETGTQGTYLVKVFVYTKKKTVTADEFKFAAVHGVMFKGFQGKGFSAQKPMVKPESEGQHSDYFKTFFNDGDYLSYATIVNAAAGREKVGKQYKLSAIVSVSKDLLRKTLEKAGVIRGLNSGF